MTTKRHTSKLFRDFESRFGAELSRVNVMASSTAIFDATSALMLLANAKVYTSQRVSILAAVSPSSHHMEESSTFGDVLDLVHHYSVATVVRQCDNNVLLQENHGPTTNTTRHVASGSASVRHGSSNDRQRVNDERGGMTEEQMQAAIKTSVCKKCGKYGHWFSDRREDGSLPNDFSSSTAPIVNNSDKKHMPLMQNNGTTDKKNLNTMTFNNVKMKIHTNSSEGKRHDVDDEQIGPLVDSGAPYSAVGNIELAVVSCMLMPD